ncbi:Dynactin subunit 4 [Zancudomyces culisetae]|uniref:Dynactin subunit 4 n=1 Tax=Zancudomyces culisetae TaxID=1213189 RepID=A0A1R1PXA7_ZANCU|nr:Dynactin subunit 4 [Zancudomyces culisetae]|eukprot:OMH85569.1 Dynactin subunit 4 [Zancudomyces culisetae]
MGEEIGVQKFNPRVYYNCSCEVNDSQVGKTEGGENDIVQYRKKKAQHNPDQLFFCYDCDAIRCKNCVFLEAAGFYCPTCLFEVPMTSVRAENNSCGRNCHSCPVCDQILVVLEGSGKKDMNDVDGDKKYWFQCGVCAWDSREIGWEFSKPTGISGQIAELGMKVQASEEFDNLVQHFSEIQKQSEAERSNMTNTLRAYRGIYNKVYGIEKNAGLGAADSNPSDKNLKEYSAKVHVDEDQAVLIKLAQAKTGDECKCFYCIIT